MRRERALASLGVVAALVGLLGLPTTMFSYTGARARWRVMADARGTASYDPTASDRAYERAERALDNVRRLSHTLGLGVLLLLTTALGRARVRTPPLPLDSAVSPARALSVVWLDMVFCLALLLATHGSMLHGARLSGAVLDSLRPWLLATLLTAPVAAGFTLAGCALGVRLRDASGHIPSPLRALATLPLLPLTWLSAIVGLPVHLLLLALRRHPGAAGVTPHTALAGLHTIRWRRTPRAA